MLDDETPADDLTPGRHRAPREIEMRSAHHVDERVVLERPELRAGPRVEVEQLVLHVATVIANVEIDDAAVVETLAEPGDERRKLVVVDDACERTPPAARRPPPVL